LQGVGAALMTPPTLTIINQTFRDPKERATAIGIWGSVAALAFAVGPLLGGLISQHLHWTWVFFVNVPIVAVGLLAGARLIPESVETGASRQLDAAGLTIQLQGSSRSPTR
jgi:MFS family permease